MLMGSKLINTFMFEPGIRKCSTATDTSPYRHLSVHVHSGGSCAICPSLWTVSRSDEQLTVNRLLLSLNSCLSTSLIKTRGRLRKKIKPANETTFHPIPFNMEEKIRSSPRPQKGAIFNNTSVHSHERGHHCVFVHLTSIHGLSIKSTSAPLNMLPLPRNSSN